MRLNTELFSVLLVFTVASVLGVESDPTYWLYTRRNAETPQRVEAEVEYLIRSSFYAMEPIVLSIPRWQGNANAVEHTKVVAAQLSRQPCNVIVVDLSESDSEEDISASITELLIFFHQQFDVPVANLMLVGFEAGAHLAGNVATRLQSQIGQSLPYITALDPSDGTGLAHELSSSDAAFVEVIHTNGGGLGTMKQLGHVDYYPNGGLEQPGSAGDSASHERALDLAIEMWSTENEFISALCNTVEELSADQCRWSTVRMGAEATDRGGIYFLDTRSEAPFGLGAYHISFL